MNDNISNLLLSTIALVCLTTVLSMVLTCLLLWLLPKWGMLDKPDFKRHIHTHAIPRGGGIGMFLTFAAVSLVYFITLPMKGEQPFWPEVLKMMLPLAILLPLGILDDRFGLRARTKLLFQIIAAVVAWWLGFRMNGGFGVSFPVWLGYLLTVFWIVLFINAFNMIDGVDGLASGIGFISAVCLAVAAFCFENINLGMLLIILGGSLLGFLFYNWHPARIFMGDTGSMFIGYMLAISGLRINASTISVASIGIPLLACGLPVLDVFLAVWRRIIGKPGPKDEMDETDEEILHASFPRRLAALVERLGSADQSHIHHRILRHFQNNQQKTIYSLYALACVMGLIGIICSFLPNRNLLLTVLIILGTFSFIINRLAFIELWNSTESLYKNFQTARTGLLISYILNPLWDLASLVFAYFVAARGNSIGAFALLRYVGIMMIVLCCSRAYRVFWNFAASDDYFRLACTLLFGSLLVRGIDFIFRIPHVYRVHSYAAGIAITFILMERLFLHFFRNAQIRRHSRAFLAEGEKPVRTVLIGVTPLSRLYRNLLAADIERAAREEIVGLVAVNRRFVHSYCYSMNVLGHINDLEYILKQYHVAKVVLTRELNEEEVAPLLKVCKEANVLLMNFDYVEQALNQCEIGEMGDEARDCGKIPSNA